MRAGVLFWVMFELNGSDSDVQKTKTKTASRLCFWLPKIRTLDETIEKRCHKRAHKNSTGKCLICVRKKIYHGPVLNLKFWVGFDCFTFFTDESRMKNSYFHYWISGISPPEMNPFGADARTLTGWWLGGGEGVRFRRSWSPLGTSIALISHNHTTGSGVLHLSWCNF